MSKDRSILVIGMAAIMLFSILGVTLLAVSSNSISGGGNAAHIDNENIVMYDEEESLVEIPDTGIIVDSKEDEPSEPVISEPEITEPSVEEQIVEDTDTGIIVDSKEDEPSEPVISEPEITEPSVEEQIVEEQSSDEQDKEETSQSIEDTQSEPVEIDTEPISEQDEPAEDTAQNTDSGTITVNPLIDHEVEIEYELIEDLFD